MLSINNSCINELISNLENPQFEQYAISQYVFMNDLKVSESEEKAIYEIEYIKPIRKPLKRNHPDFVAPTERQIQNVKRIVEQAFPNSKRFQNFVIRLAREYYDRKCVSELITNIGRINNEVTESQLETLRQLWRDERFPQIREYIRNNEVWKGTRKTVSDHMDKIYEIRKQLERLYLTDAEMDELESLYHQATGRTIRMDFPKASDRLDFFNRETADGLTEYLRQAIRINNRWNGRMTEIEEREMLVTAWNDADRSIEAEEKRRETGTETVNAHRFNKAIDDRIEWRKKYRR